MAYTYVVAEPRPRDCPGGVVPRILPLVVPLHGFGGQRDTVALDSAHFSQQRANGFNESGVPVLHTQWQDRGQIQHAIDGREYSSRLRILHLDQGRFRL